MSISSYVPGLTLRSAAATVLALLITAVLTQVAEVIVGGLEYPAEHTLAVPAIVTFLVISLLVGLFRVAARVRLLARPELLCVLYATLIATPLMTQGFWHRIVAITGTIPRGEDDQKLDAFSDKLWPHGGNLVAGAMDSSSGFALTERGTVTWQEIEFEEGRTARMPVLDVSAPDGASSVAIELPTHRDGGPLLVPGEPYMVSILLRPENLSPGANYHCRLYDESHKNYSEVFQLAKPTEVTILHKRGFGRRVRYGFAIPANLGQKAYLEFGLTGPGRLALCDPKMLSVAALESAYKGKMVVTQSEYDQLPESGRANLLVRPDSLWSLAGIKYLLVGYIPVRDWIQPLVAWVALISLILMSALAVGVIMRRQWIENERLPLPISRIPAALVGLDDDRDRAMPAIWTNRLMWAGFAASMAWCLARAWAFYNPQAPDLEARIELASALPSLLEPGWGGMWDGVTFTVSAIFVSLAIFMELNVLASLVIGFFLWRAQWWMGEATGLNTSSDFPHHREQQVGAWVAYAVLLLFFSRKYLWRVLCQVFARSPAPTGEPLSYRAAFALLAAGPAGILLWARWIDVSSWGMLVFFTFLVSVCFVAAKIRAECGTPFAYFGPWNAALVLLAIGGVGLVGSGTVLVALTASFFLCETVFFLIPGAQIELVELGRRARIVPRHIVYVVIFGILGGMILGGWVFLSNAYSQGGQTFKYTWAFDGKQWYYFSYNVDSQVATRRYLAEHPAALATGSGHSLAPPASQESPGGDTQTIYAYWYGAIAMGVLAVLRQLFAGFWFHPIGFMVGMSRMMDFVWGSCLVALVLRFAVLKLGGATTVRTKLQPLFIGVFLGAIASMVVLGVLAAYLHWGDVTRLYGTNMEIP